MKIYCSGIGGIGVSAYAALQNANGHTVLGSDRTESALLEDLRSQGIPVTHTQDGSQIPNGTDLFVYSEAIPESSPERRTAKERGISQKSYPEAVADLTRGKKLICVCGTHGKSSTTAMAARMLVACGLDPTVIVGTKMRELDGRNWRSGKGDIFLLEACEYHRSFLHYDPEITVMTTCDGDHFDYFSSIEDYRSAFREFLRRLPQSGTVITHCSDPDCRAVADTSDRKVFDADAIALPVLKTPGLHMQQNGQLTLGLAQVLEIPQEKAKKALSGYEGSWRRMEVRGSSREGATVIDDYGHHPREIRATIEALRSAYPKRRFLCVFQPHTHDRTLKLYDDFLSAFRGVDLLLLSNVYDARAHLETGTVDMKKFSEDIARASSVSVKASGDLGQTEGMLRELLQQNDVLLCIGAGDITDLATAMVQ